MSQKACFPIHTVIYYIYIDICENHNKSQTIFFDILHILKFSYRLVHNKKEADQAISQKHN